MEADDALTPATGADRGGARAVLIGWIIAAIVLTLAMAEPIMALRFVDPDDAMRLVEVRDWLGGQSWWDVSQHRLNRGDFPMHWSRLVDLPIAGVLWIAGPLGEGAATRIALVVVPLLALLAAMALIHRITSRLAGGEIARYAVLLAPLSAPLVYQLRPMRIDHHGWQIVLALAAVAPLLGRATWRAGALGGLALATLLTVSLEGMPIAAAIAGVAALHWAWQPAGRDRLLGLVWSLFLGAVMLHVATRGPGSLLPSCDAMSPAWLAMLGVAAGSTTLATMAGRHSVILRLVALAITGAAAATTLIASAPTCLAGPFAALPPIVRDLWYVNVTEGRPLWEQTPSWAVMTVGPPIVGLVGCWRGWQHTSGEVRLRWATMAALVAAALAIAIFVNRAGATANALAVPGAAALFHALLVRARAVPRPGRRVAATLAAMLVASPGQAAALGVLIADAAVPGAMSNIPVQSVGNAGVRPCDRVGDVRVIGRLPAGIVFAPLDITPDILAATHHRAIAGGYHRAPAALATVLTGFSASPDVARAIVLASGADYIAACPGLNETDLYRDRYPNGLWARLASGERFDWLAPIATGTPAMAWRVIRPLPSPTRRP